MSGDLTRLTSSDSASKPFGPSTAPSFNSPTAHSTASTEKNDDGNDDDKNDDDDDEKKQNKLNFYYTLLPLHHAGDDDKGMQGTSIVLHVNRASWTAWFDAFLTRRTNRQHKRTQFSNKEKGLHPNSQNKDEGQKHQRREQGPQGRERRKRRRRRRRIEVFVNGARFKGELLDALSGRRGWGGMQRRRRHRTHNNRAVTLQLDPSLEASAEAAGVENQSGRRKKRDEVIPETSSSGGIVNGVRVGVKRRRRIDKGAGVALALSLGAVARVRFMCVNSTAVRLLLGVDDGDGDGGNEAVRRPWHGQQQEEPGEEQGRAAEPQNGGRRQKKEAGKEGGVTNWKDAGVDDSDDSRGNHAGGILMDGSTGMAQMVLQTRLEIDGDEVILTDNMNIETEMSNDGDDASSLHTRKSKSCCKSPEGTSVGTVEHGTETVPATATTSRGSNNVFHIVLEQHQTDEQRQSDERNKMNHAADTTAAENMKKESEEGERTTPKSESKRESRGGGLLRMSDEVGVVVVLFAFLAGLSLVAVIAHRVAVRITAGERGVQ